MGIGRPQTGGEELGVQSMTLEVRVQPRPSCTEVVVLSEGKLRVYVSAPPEGGKANNAVIAAPGGAARGSSGATGRGTS